MELSYGDIKALLAGVWTARTVVGNQNEVNDESCLDLATKKKNMY